MKNKKRGFTLIELLFVLAIITLVVTTTVVSYVSIGNKQKEKDYNTMITNMKTAAEIYLTKNVVANTALKEQGYVNIEIEELVREGLLNEYYTVDPKTKKSMIGYCIIGTQHPTEKNNEFSNPIPCGSYLSMTDLTIYNYELNDTLNILYKDIKAIDEKGSEFTENLRELVNIYDINYGKIINKEAILEGKNIVVYEYDGKYFEREVTLINEDYCYIVIKDGDNQEEKRDKVIFANESKTFQELGISTSSNENPNAYKNFVGWKLQDERIIKENDGALLSCSSPSKDGTAITIEKVWEETSGNYSTTEWYQNINDNNYYSLTIIASGTAGDEVTLKKFERTGFYYIETDKTKLTGTITKDNSLVLEAFYNRNKSTLKIDPNSGIWNGSANIQSFTQKYESTKNIVDAVKTGYQFKGWTRTNNYGTLVGTTYTFGSSKDVIDTLTAQWEVNQYTLNLTAVTGATYAVTGCTTVTAGVKYTCTYGSSVKVTATATTGYTVSSTLTGTNISNKTNGTAFSMPVPTSGTAVTLTANATPNTNTKYVVEHYLMNTSGAYPTTATSTQTLYGTTGATLTLANLRYTTSTYNVANGIYYSHGQVDGTTSTTTNILGNGTRVIKLYYARTYGYLTTTKSGYTSTFTKYENKKMYYGGKITVSATIPATTAQYSYSFNWKTYHAVYLPAPPTSSYEITWRAPQGANLTLEAVGTRTLRKYPVTITSSPTNGGTIVVKNGTTTITTGTYLDYGTNLTITYTPTSGWTKLSSTATSITVVGNTSITASWKQDLWTCKGKDSINGEYPEDTDTFVSACNTVCNRYETRYDDYYVCGALPEPDEINKKCICRKPQYNPMYNECGNCPNCTFSITCTKVS